MEDALEDGDDRHRRPGGTRRARSPGRSRRRVRRTARPRARRDPAMPTLHSTPSASARARVYETISEARTARTVTPTATSPPKMNVRSSSRTNWTPTAARTMPSSSPVERRVQEGAERRALAGHARVAPVERVADRADDERDAARDPPALQDRARRTRRRARTRSAEIAFGVSRDSMRRLRMTRLVVACGHSAAQPIRREPVRLGPAPAPTPTDRVVTRANTAARRPRRPRRRRPAAASKIQWLAVTTTTRRHDGVRRPTAP